MIFRSDVKYAYGSILLILLVGVISIPVMIARLEIYLQKEPVELAENLSTISVPIGSWSRARGSDGEPVADTAFGAEMIEGLGTDTYLDRTYQSGSRQIHVHVAYYTDQIDDVPHVPERCWDAAGLDQSMPATTFDLDLNFNEAILDESSFVNGATGRPYRRLERTNAIGDPMIIHLPIGEAQMTITEFQTNPKNPRVRQVGGYFFLANGRLAPSAKDVRLLAFDPREKYAYYCKLQLTYRGTVQSGEADDAVVSEFVEIAEDILPDLIPEVMRCLPDWPAIEKSVTSAAAVSEAATENDVLNEMKSRSYDGRVSKS